MVCEASEEQLYPADTLTPLLHSSTAHQQAPDSVTDQFFGSIQDA